MLKTWVFPAGTDLSKLITTLEKADVRYQKDERADGAISLTLDERYDLRDAARWSQTATKSPGIMYYFAQYPTVTKILFALCLIVYLLSFFGNQTVAYLSAPKLDSIDSVGFILHQPWRIFSPAFLHTEITHLSFNMLWLFVLGADIEKRQGKWQYILFVLLTAGVSNFVQFSSMSQGLFYGFSGVASAFMGWALVASKKSGYFGRFTFKSLVMISVVGLGFGLLPLEQITGVNVANAAHISGFVFGALWAVINYKRL